MMLNNNRVLKLRKNPFALTALMWLLLWVLPWTHWLVVLPWVRLGIAVVLFIVPGVSVSMLLGRERFSLLGHASNGMALSVLFIALLGLAGRIFHLSFDTIKAMFALIGFFGLAACARYPSVFSLFSPKIPAFITILLLLVSIFVGVLFSFNYRFGIDDFTYLGYLTAWQGSSSLDFQDVFFGLEDIGQIRFWFALFPMSLALLSEISGLHGLLLLGYYLAPFFVVFVVIALYGLYEELLASEYNAAASVLLLSLFLSYRAASISVGTLFYNHLVHDKAFAAFILVPIFLRMLYWFMSSSTTPQSGMMFLLSGLSLTFTHPVILFFGIFIAAVYAFIFTVTRQEYKKLIFTAVLLFFTLLPQALLRFADSPLVSRYILGTSSTVKQPGSFDLESALDTGNIDSRILYLEGTPFYGFNPKVVRVNFFLTDQNVPLNFLASWIYFWVLGIGFLWSIHNLSRHSAAPYIFAVTLLVLLCFIPYTGWLMGYFVTARLLLRSSWFLPFGLILVAVLTDFVKFVSLKLPKYSTMKFDGSFTFVFILLFFLVFFGNFVAHRYEIIEQKLSQISGYVNKLESLSALGYYLDAELEQPARFIASSNKDGLTNYLPGLSSKSKAVFFRSVQFSPKNVNKNELDAILSLDESITMRRRLQILDKYDVDYILVQNTLIKEYYVLHEDFFSVKETGAFWLIKFHK